MKLLRKAEEDIIKASSDGHVYRTKERYVELRNEKTLNSNYTVDFGDCRGLIMGYGYISLKDAEKHFIKLKELCEMSEDNELSKEVVIFT